MLGKYPRVIPPSPQDSLFSRKAQVSWSRLTEKYDCITLPKPKSRKSIQLGK